MNGHTQKTRCGLSLVELLVGLMLAAMVAGSLSTLVETVLRSGSAVERLSNTSQTSLVIQRRLERLLNQALRTTEFSGCQPIAINGRWSCLAIRTAGQNRLAIRDLTFITYDPRDPRRLLEFQPQIRGNAPPEDDHLAWQALLQSVLNDPRTRTTLLCDNLFSQRDGATTTGEFEVRQSFSPTPQAIADYRTGTTKWNQLPWPQDQFGTQYGQQQRNITVMFFLQDQDGNAVPSLLSFQQLNSLRP